MTPPAGSGTQGSSGSNTASTTAKEQSAAGSALAVTGNSLDVDQFGSAEGAMSFAIRRAIASRSDSVSATATPSCQDGVEFSQTSTGSGQFTETIEFFYDTACTQPRRLVTLNISFTSSGGTADGAEELWDTSGNVVDYKTDNAAFTLQSNSQQLAQITVQRAVAAAPSATPFGENGFTCIFTGSNPIDCGNATVATINDRQLDPRTYGSSSPVPSPSASSKASPTPSPTPFEIGFTGTVTGTQATPSPSASPSSGPNFGWNPHNVQMQLTIAGTGYTGATQSMSISPATAPSWMVSGGSQVTTLSGTATIGFGGSGMISNANITLVDSSDGLTITLTSISRGGLSGTVTNSADQTVASVTVDANGDGTIDYTSGATAQIRDWVILST